jgi:hypothetical protein
MPPAGGDRPTPAERRTLTAWIAGEMLGIDPADPDRGCVTLRRLHRMEYEYSVQDLSGASQTVEQDYGGDVALPGSDLLRLRDRLPPDETAYGFDNIGDFLTLPPALLERYFDIAEAVVDQIVVVDGPHSPERSLSADDFTARKTSGESTSNTRLASTRRGPERIESI